MSTADAETSPAGLERTCWQGMEIGHPADWEPGFLSGPDVPGRCVFVDRRFQRLEVHWRDLPRRPDLKQMYTRLAKSRRKKGVSALTDVGRWEGFVCREEAGSVVYAGCYFPDPRRLVEAVLIWPGRRDRKVERAVLGAIRPQGPSKALRWQALGLSASLPRDFRLTEAKSLVGRVTWDFRRPGRRGVGLSMERIVMGRAWLKAPLSDWVRGQLPQGFRPVRELAAEAGPHRGVELRSRRSNVLRWVLGLAVSRVDVAWSCPQQDRVYRVGLWQRTSGDVDWPEPLEVRCCRTVRIGPGVG